MTKFIITLQNWFHDEKGATAIEYGLLAAGISIVLVVAAFALGDEIETVFNDLTTAMQGG